MAEPRTDRLLAERYALLEELGRGGMGTVWRAQDTLLGRPVAIKELHLPEGADAASRREFSERLLREARAAARLDHPGIVTVHDVVTAADGAPCIVMELVESRTLAQVVDDHGPMPASMVVSVALQVLDALQAAHRAGIVHRDVKPGNILVRPHGQVALTDFGIALADDDPRLTSTGMLVGSPGYLAPERISGDRCGPESDLWALGATLFLAVEGRPPFERDSTAATLYAVMHDQPQLHVAQGALARAILGLLAARPGDRPTPAQLRALLTAPPESATVTGTSPAPPPRTRVDTPAPAPAASTGRRRAWRIAVAVGLVLAFAAGVVLTGLIASGREEAAVAGGADTTATLTYGPGGTLPEFELSGPTCGDVALNPGTVVTYSASTICTEPHIFELFASADTFTDSTELAYPGEDALGRYGQAWCGLVFSSGQILGDDKDRLRVTTLIPSEAAFTTRDSPTGSTRIGRDVYCVLGNADGSQLTGQRRAPA